MQIRRSAAADLNALVDIWLRSVHATHDFLTEDDIASLLPLVREFARSKLEICVLCSDEGNPMGFLGLSGSKIEALLLAPGYQRRGYGRRSVRHARELKGKPTVDVNEQNPAAVRSIRHAGSWSRGGRSSTARGGRSRSCTSGKPRPSPRTRLNEHEGIVLARSAEQHAPIHHSSPQGPYLPEGETLPPRPPGGTHRLQTILKAPSGEGSASSSCATMPLKSDASTDDASRIEQPGDVPGERVDSGDNRTLVRIIRTAISITSTAQHRVTVPAYKPEAQARVSRTLACASGLYHLCGESQECYPNRSDFEPCPITSALLTPNRLAELFAMSRLASGERQSLVGVFAMRATILAEVEAMRK